jgi:hypothetical protein
MAPEYSGRGFQKKYLDPDELRYGVKVKVWG